MEQLPLELPGPGGVRRLSLVRLSSEIARSLSVVGRVAVEGEVIMPRSHPGGVYFTLRDRNAQLAVRCPAARSAQCRAVAGERVLVSGAVSWLNERGQLQFVAEEVAPVGEGAIAAAITERRERLAAEGFLSRPRHSLPVLPVAIGVICGTEAAVRADIESVVAARFPGYPVVWVATNVSGLGAAEAITAALLSLDARPDVEVIILARGGGDAAQLLPFSDESLCRAICACTTPVVSAIGHDGDHPLCDEVADLRCGTPSLAAAVVIPSRAELENALEYLRDVRKTGVRCRLGDALVRLAAIDMERAIGSGFDVAAVRLREAISRARLVHPARAVEAAAVRLERLDWRAPTKQRCERERQRLDGSSRHLDALSPSRVLERGYAVVRDESGAVIRDSGRVAVGRSLDVEVASGHIGVRVEQVQE